MRALIPLFSCLALMLLVAPTLGQDEYHNFGDLLLDHAEVEERVLNDDGEEAVPEVVDDEDDEDDDDDNDDDDGDDDDDDYGYSSHRHLEDPLAHHDPLGSKEVFLDNAPAAAAPAAAAAAAPAAGAAAAPVVAKPVDEDKMNHDMMEKMAADLMKENEKKAQEREQALEKKMQEAKAQLAQKQQMLKQQQKQWPDLLKKHELGMLRAENAEMKKALGKYNTLKSQNWKQKKRIDILEAKLLGTRRPTGSEQGAAMSRTLQESGMDMQRHEAMMHQLAIQDSTGIALNIDDGGDDFDEGDDDCSDPDDPSCIQEFGQINGQSLDEQIRSGMEDNMVGSLVAGGTQLPPGMFSKGIVP